MVHLFNIAGYSLLFGYFGRQSSAQLSSKIERHIYNEKDLVEIKIHLNLPYYNSQNDYESLEGEITLNGNHYNYVKRKVSQDTLFLMCLPNREKDNLLTAKNDYAKTANDFDGEAKSKNAIKKENGFSQYHSHIAGYSLTPPEIAVKKQCSFISLFVPASFISRYDLPPELSANISA